MLVFVGLQKAFDTVNHISKSEYYGFCGPINSGLKSYLYNRKQIVTGNGYESEIKLLKHGVPTGKRTDWPTFISTLYKSSEYINIKF